MSKSKPMHGTMKARGCPHLSLGNFCKLFPEARTWAEDFGIRDRCEAERVAEVLGGPGGLMHDQTGSPDNELPAGYTFFAQFVDHDITLDTRSDLHGDALDTGEVDELSNLRSASLDLDNVYSFGPEAAPFLFDQRQNGRLLIGNDLNPDDVPRNEDGRALIGDPRNDENLFVSQLQLLFLRFHNRRLAGRSFEQAQEDVRYHYQWIVLFDFLRRVCSKKVYKFALERILKKKFPLCDIRVDCGRLCMPVEFSVAAFRFGHSLVRSEYPVNADFPVIELFDERFGTLGFGAVPPELVVDWRLLLDVDECHDFVRSKAMDHLLADELIRLPDPVVGRRASANDRSLPFRNLLRGFALGLPSGQRVAQELSKKGYPIDPKADLCFEDIPGWACLPEDLRDKLKKHTPLFFYLMREGGALEEGQRLGPVGSAILMEVFGAMLVLCHSFLHGKDGWQPDPCVAGQPKTWKSRKPEDLTLADIVRYVGTG